jgi:TPP-dependent pyruvate/acetoin dehydrogenase alpha subunit
MKADTAKHLQVMYLIRRFEETVLENYSKGVFSGTTHTYLGQEANAAGILHHLQSGDIVVSNHRCHGHFLAYGGDPRALFGELMGKASGVCGGRGGSQHLHWRNFYSNGILGGMLPVATGMALAEKLRGNPVVVVSFLGDGALGEGVAYESFNMAALWRAPVLFVVEHNRIAQTTPSALALAGSIPGRFTAFSIPVTELDSSDVVEISQTAGELLRSTREKSSPHALILHTCRFGPHSKGDDTRPPEEIARMRSERDPVEIHAARLEPGLRQIIYTAVDEVLSQAYNQALADSYPSPADQHIRSETGGAQP